MKVKASAYPVCLLSATNSTALYVSTRKPSFHSTNRFYTNLIARETALVENMTARLMGNYCFLAPGIPAQTAADFDAVNKSVGQSGGSWVSLGDDVNAIFFIPRGSNSANVLGAADPKEAAATYLSHVGGKGLPTGYDSALSAFSSLLGERSASLGASSGLGWFNVEGESLADAFLRRLKADDPQRAVFEEYAEELASKFSAESNASFKDFGSDNAAAKNAILEVEKRYAGECAALSEEGAAEAFGEFTGFSDADKAQGLDRAASLVASK